MKKCNVCKEIKPLSEYNKDRIKKDGLRGTCKKCQLEKVLLHYHKNKTSINTKRKENNSLLKKEVYKKYGNKCNCCGESNIYFLQIDHVNNDGFKERHRTNQLYKELINSPIDSRYQLLCANCNWGKYLNGGICPHEEIYSRIEI